MGYRDESIALRERIDALELSLAKTAGRAMFFEERAQDLQQELGLLKGDPKALLQERYKSQSNRFIYGAMQVVGVLMLALGLAPLVIMTVVGLVSGEPTVGLMCGAFVALLSGGAFLLKLPELMQRYELRREERAVNRALRQRGEPPRARVGTPVEGEAQLGHPHAAKRRERQL